MANSIEVSRGTQYSMEHGQWTTVHSVTSHVDTSRVHKVQPQGIASSIEVSRGTQYTVEHGTV